MTREMTVTQLASYLKGVFDDEELLHDVTLSGEIAEVSYSDKHTYLTLSDGAFSVRCAHFRSRDNVQKGMRVALRGSVTFYDRRASVTFVYTDIFVSGSGEKNAALAKLKEKLRAAGLFENRPKLPTYVLNVAVVTSPEGAAIRDFIRVVGDYCNYVRIDVCPVRVQGDGAAEQIVRALEGLRGSGYDAIVLCRGGGSDEDLDCFNDERLAVAVAESKIPVISAVGHEVDYTLCDFCAGTRAGTPSIAGQIVGARAASLMNDIKTLACEAETALVQKYEKRRTNLDRIGLRITGALDAIATARRHDAETTARRGLYALEKKYDAECRTVKDSFDALGRAAERMTEAKWERLNKLAAVLNALDPDKIRKRGYAAVYGAVGAVRSASEIKSGDEVKLVFADGSATAVITDVATDNRR